MGNVTIMGGRTKLDLPVQRIMDGVDADKLESILILGWDKDGELFAASSTPRVGEMLHLMEMFKYELLSGAYDD